MYQPTHDVTNQVPPLEDRNLAQLDQPLLECVRHYGAAADHQVLLSFGEALGKRESLILGADANVYPPTLRVFDRYGHRIDEVRYHPAYHSLMSLAKAHGVHSVAWEGERRPGGHVCHTALEYLLGQVESGICCPLTMTYAVVPALEHNAQLSALLRPKLLSRDYDPELKPVAEKSSLMMGMAMTEKQGGSDVRANTTRAQQINQEEYLLTGHKWFCSAPMSDAFLTLAQTTKGLTCFYVPRVLPDGAKNRIFIQRLKDKLGNRSNASSEIEYHDTWALRVGPEGRGVPTIIEMVHHTRLDCAMAAVGLMRQALTQAVHHAQHRSVFGRVLIEQPLMQNVLADMAIEWEASLRMGFRVAQAYDQSDDPDEAGLARLTVAVAKYWTNKRCGPLVGEAMECLGGAGYVEESILPRLYREAPLNGIWEGSGNVICLDVLRAMQRHPSAIELLIAELSKSRGASPDYDRELEQLKSQLLLVSKLSTNEAQHLARQLTESIALQLQAAELLSGQGTDVVADAFIRSRLCRQRGMVFGTLPAGLATADLVARVIT